MSGPNGVLPMPPDLRRAQLVELLDRLPPEKAEKLGEILRSLVGARQISPLLEDIIHRLALRAGDAGEDQPNALMRRICTLFEPFLVTSDQPADWLILRASLLPWWCAAMAASPALRRGEEMFIQAVQARQAEAIEQAVEATYHRLAEITQTLTIRGASAALRQDLRKIAALLANRPALCTGLAALGIEGPVRAGQEIELDDAMPDAFARQYVFLALESELDPLWLGHAVMNRLARPWTGLLLVKAVFDSRGVAPLAQIELAPLVTRAFWHLSQLGRAAEAQLRRAAKIRNAGEIARAAVVTERYFAGLQEATDLADLPGFSRHAQARLTERAGVVAAVTETLGLFEGVVGNFLRHWAPRPAEADNPELTVALDAAALLGAVKALGPDYSFERPAAAAVARLGEALARTPVAATGAALRQWGQHRAGLLHNLRLVLE